VKVIHADHERLVLAQRRVGLRAVSAFMVVAAIAVVLLADAGREVRCGVEASERVCRFVERRLLTERVVTVVSSRDIERVEVVTRPDGDEESHCVHLVAAGDSHQVGRCSSIDEPRLHELERELDAFRSGEAPSAHVAFSNAGIVALGAGLPGLLGLLLLLVVPTAHADFDRARGTLVLRIGSLLRRRRRSVDLDRIRAVTVEVGGANEDTVHELLVLRLSDGERLELSSPAADSLEEAKAAIETFVARFEPAAAPSP
jgi:hypothetical protein